MDTSVCARVYVLLNIALGLHQHKIPLPVLNRILVHIDTKTGTNKDGCCHETWTLTVVMDAGNDR